jgi:hypothetical protein
MKLGWVIARRTAIILLWCWAALTFLNNVFGIVGMLENPAPARDLIAHGLTWLFSTPWWMPPLLAATATATIFVLPLAGRSNKLPSRNRGRLMASATLDYNRSTGIFTVIERQNVRYTKHAFIALPELDPIRVIRLEFEKPIGEAEVSASTSLGRKGAGIELKEMTTDYAEFWITFPADDQELYFAFFRKPARKKASGTDAAAPNGRPN